MADSIHKTLMSMRLKVICLGFALRSELLAVQEARRKPRALFLAARDCELAAVIDELQFQTYNMVTDSVHQSFTG